MEEPRHGSYAVEEKGPNWLPWFLVMTLMGSQVPQVLLYGVAAWKQWCVSLLLKFSVSLENKNCAADAFVG